MLRKKLIQTLSCEVGDILAEDVINNNLKILARDTIINEFIKSKLINLGVYSITIYDNYREDNSHYVDIKKEYDNIIMLNKKLIMDIFSGSRDADEIILEITNSIYGKLIDANYMMSYISELKNKDLYTFTHSVNVGFYSMLMAKWMRLSENQVKEIIVAGLLHDIGKTKIDDKILNKPGRLTKEEFDEMKKHPRYGYDIVKKVSQISEDIKTGILFHHERMDGSGYPSRLKNDEINLYSRIIAIADTYDAMTSNRVYKKRVTPFESFNMFLTTGMTIYDIKILNTFLNNITPYYIGAKVLLDDGTKGKIVYIPPYNIVSPIINVDTKFIDFSRENTISVVDIIS